MPKQSAAAMAHPNIAFIKYWGNRDRELRIPANSSLSMNLEGLETKTLVRFDSELAQDEFILNEEPASHEAAGRVTAFLDVVRGMANLPERASVASKNNFPSGAGVASSASAFAALALAASRAAGLVLDTNALSRLARRGSGSASRSVPDGFVEWHAGENDADSYAESVAPADHWALRDCIVVVSEAHKAIGSSEGHDLADSSPFQEARIAGAQERLENCRRAIVERDFATLADVVELDSLMMHSVMMSSMPALFYWEPATLGVLKAVRAWRADGLEACATVDAGPNVHVICPEAQASEIVEQLTRLPGVLRVLESSVGGGAKWLEL
ncbi:MAG: diphosphomevalonate decarboxylase [Chloroflexi bacterium]|nr:diphosphomevalonate decarboxylase [Chloroflexota bacterium]MQC26657.1 diphosphomevalonate decarboxylase [Chloroflexota bacterium]